MTERFDAAMMGMGAAGEEAASRLLSQGLRVAAIERELIGGECACWACIPSKTLLSPETAPGRDAQPASGNPEQNWVEIAAYRDFMIRNLDHQADHRLRSRGRQGAQGRSADHRTRAGRRRRSDGAHRPHASSSRPAARPGSTISDSKSWRSNRRDTSQGLEQLDLN